MPNKAQQKHRTNRVFKSLHKPLTYLGVERTLFYFVCVGAVGSFNLFNSILAGIAVFIGGFAFGHWVTNSDPAFLRILAKSERYKLRYDAAKQQVPRVEAALKAFGPGFHVYQYLFKSNRPDIPFARYDDPIVEAAIDQRRKFFEAKRDHLYQVEIFYCVLLEGARSKTGVGTALARLLRDPEGAIAELKSQFTNDNMKTLLRTHIER